MIASIVGVIVYKLLISNLTFDFSKFDFSDLLSLILALFSIGLAVAFYFKATDTSNDFYDNTYKFTKDISEILGRIEAGFGERLKHLDEGYSGINEKILANQLKSPQVTVEKAEKEIESEKKKIDNEIRERDRILENLMMRAKVQEKEKESILKSIKEKDETIINLNKELHLLKRRIENTGIERAVEIPDMPVMVYEILRNFISNYLGPENIRHIPKELLNRRIKRFLEELNESSILELRRFGIISDDKNLTAKGFEFVDIISKRYYR